VAISLLVVVDLAVKDATTLARDATEDARLATALVEVTGVSGVLT
jgi:hypothetical protein